MPYTFPANELEQPQKLLAELGSLWARTYGGSEQVLAYVAGIGQVEQQAANDLQEAVDCLSLATVPTLHKDRWYCLTLRESALNTDADAFYHWDGEINFDAGYQFDVTKNRHFSGWPLPAGLREAPLICNRITDPTVSLFAQLDFVIDAANESLILRTNPFDNPLWSIRAIYENGEVVDRELTAWVFRAGFEHNRIYNHYGHVLGIHKPSSTAYRDLVSAAWQALVNGPTQDTLLAALAAAAGVDVTHETETVEDIRGDNDGQLIITDKRAYRFSANALPVVSVGDILPPFSPLVDAVQLLPIRDGRVPSGLEALVLDKGFLAGCYYGELVFENRNVELVVDTAHASGYTYLSFELGGFPADVTRFFDEMHARGVAAAQQERNECDTQRRGTLAHLLDSRNNPATEPTAAYLPATINPLKFLIENVLRFHVTLVRIKASGIGSDALGLYNVRHLLKHLHPGTAVLLLVETELPLESVTAAQVTGDPEPFDVGEPLTEEIPVAWIDDSHVTCRLVAGRCQ